MNKKKIREQRREFLHEKKEHERQITVILENGLDKPAGLQKTVDDITALIAATEVGSKTMIIQDGSAGIVRTHRSFFALCQMAVSVMENQTGESVPELTPIFELAQQTGVLVFRFTPDEDNEG